MGNRQKVPHTFKLELDASDWSAESHSHFPLVSTDEDDKWSLRGGLGKQKNILPIFFSDYTKGTHFNSVRGTLTTLGAL
jgi:hypothetical protein